ncbi:MAG: adenylyltransferase/cytidyltransferase family protein [Elusimicrobiota bacterium]|nr:adenylyltransferase/cytidyltransferase family protein [Elusimicrobiota bacterium]
MILSEKRLKDVIARLKKKNKKIVFTNGCFDILHIGHIRLLEKAKSSGDYLIVAINSDSSVRQIKGRTRPVVAEKYRAEIVDSIKYVDFVIIFNDKTPERIIKMLKPDILVKGADWRADKIVGREYVKKVIRVPLVKGVSTTNLIEKFCSSLSSL